MQQNIELVELDQNSPDHLQTMYVIRTHPEVDHYLRGSPPANYADHVNYLRKVGPHKEFYLIRSDAELCGYCQLTHSEGPTEIGIALHPSYWNKKIGYWAMSLLLEKLKETALILFVKKDNVRALALYTKLGFKVVGSENAYGEYTMKKTHDH